MAENVTSAIVTTVRKPDRYFPWWCYYHLGHFTNIYVYVDVDTLPQKNIPKIPGVVVFEGVQPNPNIPNSPAAVMGRQEKNCLSAIAHARNSGHQWLAHLDSDELIYIQPSDSSPKALCGDRFALSLLDIKADVINLTNHEALLVDKYVRGNYFLNPYFKINGHPQCPSFLAYGNGKSAVRLVEDAEPLGVHDFWIRGRKTKRKELDNPYVLHFPNATSKTWLAKYQMLGNFSDYWDEDRTELVQLEFHKRSRDIVQSCLKVGNYDAARQFYRENLLDLDSAESLVGKGIEKIIITG